MAKLLKHFTNFLQNPVIDAIANTIKKFKSSKSYWSTSYALIFLMAREAIAIKWGTKVEAMAQSHLTDTSLEWYEKFFWYASEFLFSNGAIWLLALFVLVFLVLSLVKVSESEKSNVSIKENYLTIFFLITLMGLFIYSGNISQKNQSEIISSVKDESKEIKELIKDLAIYGNKEKFLKSYFGKDWIKVLENPQTYQNLKLKLSTNTKTTEELLKERDELLKKITSQRLKGSVQKMIDKAFNELRYKDVRDLLDNFIETNQDIGDDLIKAHFQKALSYMEQIEYYKAKAEFEEFIPMGIKNAEILHEYGILYYKLGEYDKMLECNIKALVLNIKEFGKNNVFVAKNYNEIGVAWGNKGVYDKAIESYDKALKIRLATLGVKHPSTATSYNNIGLAWYSKGEYDKAIEFYDKALKIRLVTLGKNHLSTATSYNNIGSIWQNKGENDKAIEFYDKALKIRLTTLGENHPSTATSYNNIGSVWQSKGEYDKAIEFYNKDLKITFTTLGENHPSTATSYNNIGSVWQSKGEYNKAIEFYDKALKIYIATLGENHPSTATSYNNIAILYFINKEYAKAYPYAEKVVQIRELKLPSTHPNLIESKRGLEMIKEKLKHK